MRILECGIYMEFVFLQAVMMVVVLEFSGLYTVSRKSVKCRYPDVSVFCSEDAGYGIAWETV